MPKLPRQMYAAQAAEAYDQFSAARTTDVACLLGHSDFEDASDGLEAV